MSNRGDKSILGTVIVVVIACIVAFALFSFIAAVLGAAFALLMRILSIAVPILIICVAVFIIKSKMK